MKEKLNTTMMTLTLFVLALVTWILYATGQISIYSPIVASILQIGWMIIMIMKGKELEKKLVKQMVEDMNEESEQEMENEIEELFGGSDAEEQNALRHVLKNRGYEWMEKTPVTSMTVRLIDDLHKLGYKIVKK